MADITLRELPASDRATAGTIWTALESRLGNGSITTSWAWTSCWLTAFGDLVPHVFIIAELNGEVIGMTLVTRGVGQRRGPLPVRTIHIGTAGEPPSDAIATGNHRILVEERHRSTFAHALIDHIRRGARNWDELAMYGFDPEHARPFLDAPGSWHIRREICRVSDLDAIRASGGDVLASLGKTTRRNLRRSMREVGPVETEQAHSPAHAREILDELIELHQNRWHDRGEPGAFAGERFRRFHYDLVDALIDQGRIMMFRARTSTRTLGCKYGFIERNHMISYQVGTADFEGRVNPGLLTNLLCMQHCLDIGLSEFNLMPADMPYKQELTNTTRELLYPVLARSTPRELLLRYARHRRFGPSIPIQELSPIPAK